MKDRSGKYANDERRLDVIEADRYRSRIQPGPYREAARRLADTGRVVIERDLSDWRAVMRGVAPTWKTIVGSEDAPWLTTQGQELASRMTTDLQRILGDDWVAKAFNQRETGAFSLLALMSPSLHLREPSTAFNNLVAFWLALTSTEECPGYTDVLVAIKSDLQPHVIGHALVQLRVATLARAAGCGQVAFEHALATNPVDVVLVDEAVGIEIYTPTLDDRTKAYDQAHRENLANLDKLARLHRVHWSGDVPADGDEQVIAAWKAQTEQAAKQSASDGVPVQIAGTDGTELIATPGPAPVGVGLSGPLLTVDVGARLRGQIWRKAEQATRSGANILWIDDHGATGLLFDYEVLSPGGKLEALSDLVQPILNSFPAIDALVFARELGDIRPGNQEDLQVARGESSFIGSKPYPGTTRETAVLSQRHAGQMMIAERIAADEQRLWLQALSTATGLSDWAQIVKT